jgi:ATP-dependent Clp protease ATP-binding subunit ClpC
MDQSRLGDESQRALALAREHALRLRHRHVGTEHMLLALLDERELGAAGLLQRLGVDLDRLHRRVAPSVKPGKSSAVREPRYTSRAQVALELADAEAGALHQEVVQPEHLLLGLLREERGIAAQSLRKSGVTLERARNEMRQILGIAVPVPSRSLLARFRSRFRSARPTS